jgi:hypothetical protein
MDPVHRVIAAMIGSPVELPVALAERYPELRRVRWRRGGLPPRVGGWALGSRSVAAITLGRTVFLAPDAPIGAELLLHELAHVEQFEGSRAFPLRYLWESARVGYASNRYEIEARRFVAARVNSAAPASPPP